MALAISVAPARSLLLRDRCSCVLAAPRSPRASRPDPAGSDTVLAPRHTAIRTHRSLLGSAVFLVDMCPMRPYPPPSKDVLTAFIYHSVQLERLPITFGDISRSMTLKETDADMIPRRWSLQSINHVLKIAKEDNLLKDLEWTKTLHKMLFEPIVRHEWITASDQSFPPTAVGTYRLTEKFIGTPVCPTVPNTPLMEELRQKLVKLDQRLATKMTNRRLLTPDDLMTSEQPPTWPTSTSVASTLLDGSNRVGRLVENCLRSTGSCMANLLLRANRKMTSSKNSKLINVSSMTAHQRQFK